MDNLQSLLGGAILQKNSKNMSYNFIRFQDTHSRSESRITVTGTYSIGFPTKFYKDNNVESFKYAVLFWDAGQMAIGILLTNDENQPGRFKIGKTRDYGAMVSAKSFFTKNEIDPKLYKGRYDWEKVQQPDAGEIFVIKLPKG